MPQRRQPRTVDELLAETLERLRSLEERTRRLDGIPTIDTGTLAGGVLAGSYPNPSFAVPMATDAKLDAHIFDPTGAHAATAVGYDNTVSGLVAIEVQAALDEIVAGGGGGGAPSTADYLVGTAQGGLSAEIVVGPTPGGELGNTWASPTVDTIHSGSSHAATQAAAEATAAAALAAHIADATAAHAASAISFTPVGGIAATDVQAALAELDAEKAPATVDYLVGTAAAGLSGEIVVGTTPGGELGGTWASPTVDATHSGSAHSSLLPLAGGTMSGTILFNDIANIGATGTGSRVRNVYASTALFVGNTAGSFASLNTSTFNVSGAAGFFGTGTAHDVYLMTAGSARWQVTPTGHFIAQADNTYDIGASGGTRPRAVYIAGGITTGETAFMHRTSAALANGAAAALGTLTNAPAAGNPTKWIPINDSGVIRHIPSW